MEMHGLFIWSYLFNNSALHIVDFFFKNTANTLLILNCFLNVNETYDLKPNLSFVYLHHCVDIKTLITNNVLERF